MVDPHLSLAKADADALREAVALLEHPSLAARLTNMVGKPVDIVGRALPTQASQVIAKAAAKSLEGAFKLALLTIRKGRQPSSQLLHRTLAVTSGAAGGAFGIASLPVELPVSTIIILRSILDIARGDGENLTDPEATLSCVAVLGLGGRTETDDEVKSGYFVTRGVLAMSVTEAARGVVVTQKTAAQAIPVIGALGGAAVNYVFIDHFQSVARGHFTVRRLERQYGKDIVFAAYEQLRQGLGRN
jgi:hypothetical protein